MDLGPQQGDSKALSLAQSLCSLSAVEFSGPPLTRALHQVKVGEISHWLKGRERGLLLRAGRGDSGYHVRDRDSW